MIGVLIKFILHLWMKEKCKCGVGSVIPPTVRKDLKALVVWHGGVGRQ